MSLASIAEAIAKKVLSISPTIATALGGPVAGMVVSALSNYFNVAPAQLSTAIDTDPDAAVKIKKFELDNQVELANAANDLESIESGDTQDARRENKAADNENMLDEIFVHIFALIITIGFFWSVYMVFQTHSDGSDHDILNMMLGLTGTVFVSVVNYYFGGISRKTITAITNTQGT